MIYFDHCATTPVRKEVLDTFVKVTQDFIGNPNSIHSLGLKSKNLMTEATKQVADLMNVKPEEIIFTSSSSESNNLAIKGVFDFYPKRNRMIVTTRLEHASVLETIKSLKNVKIEFVELDEKGHIDMNSLENLLKLEPLLVTIQHVNSETGTIQDIGKIASIIRKYPKTFFHVDGTQSVGHLPVRLDDIDLFTFSAQKFFGLKASACLIKKENVSLAPLISGGHSQSSFRAGTPSVALIASFAKALRLSLEELNESYEHVLKLNQLLRKKLTGLNHIVINSLEEDSPYILNFSILGKKPETVIHLFEQHDIYVSTNTACSSKNSVSKTLLALSKKEEVAKSSIRVSFSKLNTEKEVEQFIKILKEEIL